MGSISATGAAFTDKLLIWVERIRASYWPVPTFLLLLGGGLAYLMTWLDRIFTQLDLPWMPWLFSGGSEGAQGLLTAIASSVLGVAGTTFTITIAVLTLTSQQYGPRLLRTFLQDTRNQVVLGVFIGTFLYALLVMGMVRGVDESMFVPRLAVAMALVLAVLNAFMLVYFIQHVVSSIQVSKIVATAGDEMFSAIDRMCPEIGKGSNGERLPDKALRDVRQRAPYPPQAALVVSHASGYLQAIDSEKLVKRATEAEVCVDVVRAPGEYVSAEATLALVHPRERLSDEIAASINEAVILGSNPTPTQDLAYGPRQLAEIAVRALSAGVNDPGTAIMCLDRLTAGLVLLVKREMPSNAFCDADGEVRLITRRASLERLLDVSLAQIRRYGAQDIEVLSRILRLLVDVCEAARSPSQRDALRENARLVLVEGLSALETAEARDRLQKEFDRFEELLEARRLPG